MNEFFMPSKAAASSQYTYQQFNTPTIFPQPTGNVYSINNTLEVANVPAGAGISVALCFPENLMYIKSMQNGNPLFYAYKIMPYTEEPKSAEQKTEVNYQQQIDEIFKQISSIKKDLGVE